MKIIIAGGGKVGSVLCSELATEDNDIIIIEKNEIRLEQLINKIDISGIVGNGASIDIQKEAGVENSDIFIAVTPQDEVNIMACILAQKLGAKYTIARVRNPEYSKHFDSFRESLGVNLMINPEMESARSIAKIIKFPDILSIQSFAKDQVELIELEVQKDSPLANMSLNDFRKRYGEVLVCTIRRKGETIIPSGQNTIRIGDHIYVLGNKATIRKFYKKTSRKTKNVQSVLIIGGGRLTYYLLDVLKDYHMAIKVIEQHREIAEDLSASYPNVEIILGDGTDQDILIQEGIENYNAFVSLTGVDEENIIASLYA
uniref:Trk system potassium transporter TrkA n=3 Tax=Carnobacteriaceae TaxID=186828 RepID=UPI00359F2F15